MLRTLLTTTCVLAFAGPGAFAADNLFLPDLRPAYPDAWELEEENPLRFEFGARYWYTLGGFDTDLSGFDLKTEDTTHILELHGRIEDLGTDSYVKAIGGFGVVNTGSYNLDGEDGDMVGNTVAYAGGDFGWMPFGDMREGYSLGGLVGYQYWKEAPDTGRASFTVAETAADIDYSPETGAWSVGFDSEPNNFDIHAVRLGAAARFELAKSIDLTAEAVAIPYAYIDGTFGAHDLNPTSSGNLVRYQGSTTTIAGHAYGASGELLVGFHPTENLTVRFGGRAWYLNGQYDAETEVATIQPPQPNAEAPPNFTAPTLSRQRYIQTDNPFSLFRYGALFELTGRF
ncbi:hypothetical protein GCM10007989_25620 [Devosia pacifica]|uniref:Outer membrane protein beta-barrel domain-containing protein n=1 Tax=Devosia pacifica TaxID=1335967 RepID=A0A918VVQ4_9HYPH|nr:hypothetical protein [Devosia pacifica]GHA28956.1 hypothetical protein GCM10007989_25620 [Devosia pacifica]